MEFKQQILDLGKKIEKYREKITNEEMTKTALILPFFDILGYDTRNPFEFHPEFTADLADSKGEKVDYAILINDLPQILIEAKMCSDSLDKHDKQLMRYFHTTEAKIGILTNGIIYKFYTDLEETNKMDTKPFLEINLLDMKEHEVNELRKFYKTNFDLRNIMTSAEELKYSNAIKKMLKVEFETPSTNFVSYILNEVYDGIKTQKVKDKFELTVKKSISEFINDMVRSRIEGVLEPKVELNTITEEIPTVILEETQNKIVTTNGEMEGFIIIKTLVRSLVKDTKRITYKDTTDYFNITLDNNIRKWICRLYLNKKNKYISFPEILENGERTNKEIKIVLESFPESLFEHKEQIEKILSIYLDK